MKYRDALDHLHLIRTRDDVQADQQQRAAGGGLRGFHERMKARIGAGRR